MLQIALHAWLKWVLNFWCLLLLCADGNLWVASLGRSLSCYCKCAGDSPPPTWHEHDRWSNGRYQSAKGIYACVAIILTKLMGASIRSMSPIGFLFQSWSTRWKDGPSVCYPQKLCGDGLEAGGCAYACKTTSRPYVVARERPGRRF
jgi:hypothetical protein